MAWSVADLSSDYQTWLGQDHPMFVAQVIPTSPSYAKWAAQADVGADNIALWTDRADTSKPSLRAYDGLPGSYTKPGASPTDDVWYYCLDLGALYAFDWVGIIGHNFGTLNLGNDVTIEVDDDGTFRTGNLTTIANLGTPAANDDSRISDISLSDAGDAGPNRYTAQYVRVKIDKTGTNIVPEIGLLVLGRRYQSKTIPLNSYDRDQLFSSIDGPMTRGGVSPQTVYYENQFRLDATFKAWETNRIADFKSWYKQSKASFVWVPLPNSDADRWYVMTKQSSFSMPTSDYTERSLHIQSVEQGPSGLFWENE